MPRRRRSRSPSNSLLSQPNQTKSESERERGPQTLALCFVMARKTTTASHSHRCGHFNFGQTQTRAQTRTKPTNKPETTICVNQLIPEWDQPRAPQGRRVGGRVGGRQWRFCSLARWLSAHDHRSPEMINLQPPPSLAHFNSSGFECDDDRKLAKLARCRLARNGRSHFLFSSLSLCSGVTSCTWHRETRVGHRPASAPSQPPERDRDRCQ